MRGALQRAPVSWLARLMAWLRAWLLGRGERGRAQPLRLGPGGAGSPELRARLARLELRDGATRDAVQRAATHFEHLSDVLTAPEQGFDAAEQAEVMAAAEVLLGEMIDRAPMIDRLSRIAGEGGGTRELRRDVGDAMLSFRERGAAMAGAAEVLVRWSAGDGPRRSDILAACRQRLEATRPVAD